jgi:hypothetical protein
MSNEHRIWVARCLTCRWFEENTDYAVMRAAIQRHEHDPVATNCRLVKSALKGRGDSALAAAGPGIRITD